MSIFKRLLQRISLMPWTCLVILLLNFILVHKAQIGERLKTSSLFEAKISFFHEVLTQRSCHFEKPLLFNTWPFTQEQTLLRLLEKKDPRLGLYGIYFLPLLSQLYQKSLDPALFELLILLQQKRIWSEDNLSMRSENMTQLKRLEQWQHHSAPVDLSDPLLNIPSYTLWEKSKMMLIETELFDYFNQIAHLNFGTLKHDSNQKVAPFALQRLKSSLLFLIFPLIFTFISAQFFGVFLALKEDKLLGMLLSAFFAILYAIPIYMMVPLLIEKLGLPFSWPIHGANFNYFIHYLLPLIAIIYGALAIYTRLEKTLFIQLFSREYLLTAKANGLSKIRLITVHSLREALLTTVPLFFNSLNFFIGSLIIVETLFEIDGFGRFFYQSIIHHDTNATLFCILMVSLLSMLSYLLSDLFLYLCDPRIKSHGDSGVF